MRLWHKDLIPYLPKSQLLSQWRELNSIFVKQDKHILINYIYKYSKLYLKFYTDLVIREMTRRGYKIRNYTNYDKFFEGEQFTPENLQNASRGYLEHDRRYLSQCFYNLQEKYDRGQKDFTQECYEELLMNIQMEYQI